MRPPEVLNLGVGAIRDRVVAVDGAPVVRPTLVLSVAGDHRVLDGDTLAAYVTPGRLPARGPGLAVRGSVLIGPRVEHVHEPGLVLAADLARELDVAGGDRVDDRLVGLGDDGHVERPA